MAPEQFAKKPYNPVKAEIYSLGMFFFHFLFKVFPFETNAGSDLAARNSDFIYKFQESPKNKLNIRPSKNFLDLLAMMMKYNPDERPTMDEVISSQWCREGLNLLVNNQQA